MMTGTTSGGTGTNDPGAGGTSAGSGGAGMGGTQTGSGGTSGVPPCGTPPTYSPGTPYAVGDIVFYPDNGQYYICVNANPMGYDPVVSSWYWKVHACTGGNSGTGGGGPSTTPGCPLDTYLPEQSVSFRELMKAPWQNPRIHAVFSNAYNDLCQAMTHNGLTGFAKSGTDEQNKREIAAFLANVAVETAYLQDSAQGANYANTTDHNIGRGAIQLTGYANYDAAASFLGNPSIRTNPGIVATDSSIVWQTALWFWLHYSNPSVGAPNNCHNSIFSGNFGRTIRIIVGLCNADSVQARQTVYQKACSMMGVSPGELTCSG
jgi:hypothetical protein